MAVLDVVLSKGVDSVWWLAVHPVVILLRDFTQLPEDPIAAAAAALYAEAEFTLHKLVGFTLEGLCCEPLKRHHTLKHLETVAFLGTIFILILKGT